MIIAVFLIVVLLALGLLLFSPFSKHPLWRATVTPLASIVGSGFLVSAPLLVREVGIWAGPAMAILIALAVCVGSAIRYNIAKFQPAFDADEPVDYHAKSVERLSHLALCFAYFVSVAYYLALLGAFILEATGHSSDFLGKLIATVLLIIVGALGLSGGAEKVARVERYTTALNLSVIAGLLAALAVYGLHIWQSGVTVSVPDITPDWGALPILLGLLIVVQGFEIVRFTGDRDPAELRIRAMKLAQAVSAVIYVAFFALLYPLYETLSQGEGVAAVISAVGVVAAILPVALTIAAVASQFSASIADAIGDAGLVKDVTGGRVDSRHAFGLIAFIGLALVWSVDVTGVIALASRAFALFYALQCIVAARVAWLAGAKGRAGFFALLALICAAVTLFGQPEG